jgi:hypothetical protein
MSDFFSSLNSKLLTPAPWSFDDRFAFFLFYFLFFYFFSFFIPNWILAVVSAKPSVRARRMAARSAARGAAVAEAAGSRTGWVERLASCICAGYRGLLLRLYIGSGAVACRCVNAVVLVWRAACAT